LSLRRFFSFQNRQWVCQSTHNETAHRNTSGQWRGKTLLLLTGCRATEARYECLTYWQETFWDAERLISLCQHINMSVVRTCQMDSYQYGMLKGLNFNVLMNVWNS
jgi:hypothetical protein